ncbi:MAG: GNAT family N-acetyltransferase [Terracidiphilus sp.]|jgi:CelD/BcsL family acetyltransferase involved in cellulose biosynthesis
MSNPVRAKPDGRYTVEAIVTEEALDLLEGDWNRLSAESEAPNVFMTYGWFRAWLRRLMADEGRERLQPYVLAIRRDEAIAGIAPLVRRVVSRFGLRVRKLEFLTFHADYNDLVLGEDRAGQTAAVVEFLARTTEQWELVDLKDLRGPGDVIAGAEKAAAHARMRSLFLPEEVRCPYMPIDGPWSEMMSRRSRSTRRVFRNFTVKAREGLQVRVVENPQNEPGLLQQLVTLEALKHVRGQQSGPFLAAYPDVFQSLFNILGPQGLLLIALLEWNGQLVACHLLYRCAKKIWGYFTAYDPEFSDLSPGAILNQAVVDYAFTNGFDEFDFLSGEDPYKMRWTSGFHERYRLQIWNRRWMSRAHAFAYFSLRVRRRLGRLNARENHTGANNAK